MGDPGRKPHHNPYAQYYGSPSVLYPVTQFYQDPRTLHHYNSPTDPFEEKEATLSCSSSDSSYLSSTSSSDRDSESDPRPVCIIETAMPKMSGAIPDNFIKKRRRDVARLMHVRQCVDTLCLKCPTWRSYLSSERPKDVKTFPIPGGESSEKDYDPFGFYPSNQWFPSRPASTTSTASSRSIFSLGSDFEKLTINLSEQNLQAEALRRYEERKKMEDIGRTLANNKSGHELAAFKKVEDEAKQSVEKEMQRMRQALALNEQSMSDQSCYYQKDHPSRSATSRNAYSSLVESRLDSSTQNICLVHPTSAQFLLLRIISILPVDQGSMPEMAKRPIYIVHPRNSYTKLCVETQDAVIQSSIPAIPVHDLFAPVTWVGWGVRFYCPNKGPQINSSLWHNIGVTMFEIEIMLIPPQYELQFLTKKYGEAGLKAAAYFESSGVYRFVFKDEGLGAGKR